MNANYWQFYVGGVLGKGATGAEAGSPINHCAQIVGVDISEGTGTWTIKNSWGTNWGEGGYLRLKYGADVCRVAKSPIVVEVIHKETTGT